MLQRLQPASQRRELLVEHRERQTRRRSQARQLLRKEKGTVDDEEDASPFAPFSRDPSPRRRFFPALALEVRHHVVQQRGAPVERARVQQLGERGEGEPGGGDAARRVQRALVFSTSATRRPRRLELFSPRRTRPRRRPTRARSRVALRNPCLKRSAFILLACPATDASAGEVPIRLAQRARSPSNARSAASSSDVGRYRSISVHVLDVQLGVVQPAHGVRDLRQTQRDLREHDFDVGAALQVEKGNEALAVVGTRAARPIVAE